MTIKILAIESSCDDTSAAIVDENANILSNIILTSIEQNKLYKGIVPEIAARAHLDYIKDVVNEAISQANIDLHDISAIAATCGPGLIGGVLVGASAAKALALALQKPFIAINHLEGHALTARLTNKVEYPYLLLLASGGHCQFIAVMGLGNYHLLGQTLDDSPGEAFDKTAKLLDLDYPGGPIIEKLASLGTITYSLPTPMVGKEGCDMSFSGLKTAIKLIIETNSSSNQKPNICASFQHAVAQTLSNRSKNAIIMFNDLIAKSGFLPKKMAFVFAGGVAANKYLRNCLTEIAISHSMEFIAPPINLCTDNAAMIAWAAMERFKLNLFSNLNFCPKARWPIEEVNI
jgi:N6-L-threonylcarbamoyladenine synthase